jgi:hypothetical protein
MKFLAILSMLVAPVISGICSKNAVRCIGDDATKSQAYSVSNACAVKLDFPEKDCWCMGKVATYWELQGEKLDQFKDCCNDYGGWEIRKC